jgi:excisionase family DNA binding protein
MATNLADLPPVLKVADVARVLSIGRRQAYALVADGIVRSVRIGRALRIPRSALIAFLEGEGGAER